MAIVKFRHANIPVSYGINYITNDLKTDIKFITGKDCMAESAQAEMEYVQKQYTGSGKRSYYHMMQSFSPDDKLTPELAHEIGLEMAEKCFPGHQVLVSTHLDKKHIHNHFIINAVNFETNKMLNFSYNKGIAIKELSNELCKKHGLSTTEVKSTRTDMPDWKKKLKYNLENALYNSTTIEDYFLQLRKKGITVNYNKSHLRMTYRDKDGHKCRDNKLFDERFLKENLERIDAIRFRDEIEELKGKENREQLKRKENELAKSHKRDNELNTLFKRLYEDNVLGKVTNEQFRMLSDGYNNEQRQLKENIAILEAEIERLESMQIDVDKFVALAVQYTNITELTDEILHTFISKIVIHERKQKHSKSGVQQVDIYFNNIGLLTNA